MTEMLRRSPLIRTLLLFSMAMVGGVLSAKYWPMPSVALEQDAGLSASEIASFLGENQMGMEEALKRPLFHVNRRQPRVVVEQAHTVTPVRKPALELVMVGVMGTGENRTAFLLHTGRQETHTVQVGQTVDAWLVVAVADYSVTLDREGERKVIELE